LFPPLLSPPPAFYSKVRERREKRDNKVAAFTESLSLLFEKKRANTFVHKANKDAKKDRE
jgi:hypothetical protein